MKNKILLPVITIVLGIIYYTSFNYIYTTSVNDLLNQQIENARVQANLVSSLLANRISKGNSKNQVRQELQESIENMSLDNSFICMFGSNGEEICHPKREKIGNVITENNSTLKTWSNLELELNFKEAIAKQKEIGGIRSLKNRTEIIYLSPVKNTNWVVASHANILKFKATIGLLKQKLTLLFLVIWLGSILLIFYFLHYLNKQSLEAIKAHNKEISDNYFNGLSLIKAKDNTSKEKDKQRLLADKGNKLTPVMISNIAFIYTENKINYIVEKDNKTSTINTSLDDLILLFDENKFYRASRQVIISIDAIDKIEKLGKTQLSIKTIPKSDVKIVISKAKLTGFKNWVGQN